MTFGGQRPVSSMAKTQADIVAERTEEKPHALQEELTFPGLQMIHLMNETQLIGFFTTVLKCRQSINEISITLGERYNTTERQVNVPNASKLGQLSYEDTARVIVMALGAGGNKCVGMRAVMNVTIDTDGTQRATSQIFVKVADKAPCGPVYDEFGDPTTEYDEEFEPKLTITSRP